MRQIKVKHQVLLVALCVEFCRSRFKRDPTFRTWSSPGVVLGGCCVGFGGFFGLDLRWVLFGWVFLRGDSEDGD